MGAATETSIRCPLASHGSLVMSTSPGRRVSGGWRSTKLRITSGTMPRKPAVVIVECDIMFASRSNSAQQKSWYSFTDGV